MSTLEQRQAAKDAVPDLSRPSRAGLTYLLRNPDQWPTPFKERGWDFMNQQTCAIGLFHNQWPMHQFSNTFKDITPEGGFAPVGLSPFGTEYWRRKSPVRACPSPRPEQVADALDSYYEHIA